jgi:hypothetical protein
VVGLGKGVKKQNDERQEFITRARKERMPDEEFTSQMCTLYDKERGVQRRLTTIERARDDFMQLDPEAQVKKYVAELQSDILELIHANPQTPTERHQVFLLKKRIVETVMEEVRIGENREIHVRFRTDFLAQAR